MKATIKIEGADQIIEELRRKDVDFVRLLREGLIESANLVKDKAKQKAPFRTGRLREAIDTGDLELSKGKVKIDIGINTSVKPFSRDGYYARFQEMGTSKMRAHPYLRPALDESKDEVNFIVTRKLKEAL